MTSSRSEAEAVPPESAGGESADHSSAPAETIKLDQFLKLANLVSTGGEAKMLIQGGEVFVNHEVETRRGRKLRNGDTVTYMGEDYVIEAT